MPETQVELKLEIIGGERIKSRWGQWYRHDKIKIDGKELEGKIQVRRRYYGKRFGHRVESITCYKDGCVIGSDWLWLARMNGLVIEERFGRYYKTGETTPQPEFKSA